MNIANIWEGGIRIHNKPLSLALFSKKEFYHLCCYAAVAEKINVYKNIYEK